MKKIILITLSLAGLITTARAEKPFNAAFWAPDMQIEPVSEDIRGLRLNVYGENHNMTGCDLGFGHRVTGNFTGAQIGLFTRLGGEGKGARLALINITDPSGRRFTGAHVGAANVGESLEIKGAQVGVFNLAKHVHGAQVGLVNITDTLKGVQVGLWNQVSSRSWDKADPLPRVFPIINIGL
jgi:hypothetical protein